MQTTSSSVEEFSNVRPWTKKAACPYCHNDVTHFPRHLIRNHKEEGAVREVMTLSLKNPKRKELLNIIRRQGNFASNLQTGTIRPIRRPKPLQNSDDSNSNLQSFKDRYIACPNCLGYFRRNYLRRHRKNCASRPKSQLPNREQHLSAAQLFSVCSSAQAEFYSTLRLKTEVFPIMRHDIISKLSMEDALICSYAESLLQKHKRTQIRNVISNKMRELGRLLYT